MCFKLQDNYNFTGQLSYINNNYTIYNITTKLFLQILLTVYSYLANIVIL